MKTIILIATVFFSLLNSAYAEIAYYKGTSVKKERYCHFRESDAKLPPAEWGNMALNDACGEARKNCLIAESLKWNEPFHCLTVAQEQNYSTIVKINDCDGKEGYQGQLKVTCYAVAYAGAPKVFNEGDQEIELQGK